MDSISQDPDPDCESDPADSVSLSGQAQHEEG